MTPKKKKEKKMIEKGGVSNNTKVSHLSERGEKRKRKEREKFRDLNTKHKRREDQFIQIYTHAYKL